MPTAQSAEDLKGRADAAKDLKAVAQDVVEKPLSAEEKVLVRAEALSRIESESTTLDQQHDTKQVGEQSQFRTIFLAAEQAEQNVNCVTTRNSPRSRPDNEFEATRFSQRQMEDVPPSPPPGPALVATSVEMIETHAFLPATGHCQNWPAPRPPSDSPAQARPHALSHPTSPRSRHPWASPPCSRDPTPHGSRKPTPHGSRNSSPPQSGHPTPRSRHPTLPISPPLYPLSPG
eukprot:g17242.t1